MIAIDFMVCAKKVRAKKDNVRTFGDFCQKVQDMILNLAIGSQRIDIVFDMYLKNSIKASARKSRKKSIEPVPVSINRDDQKLSSAIDSFYNTSASIHKHIQRAFLQSHI